MTSRYKLLRVTPKIFFLYRFKTLVTISPNTNKNEFDHELVAGWTDANITMTTALQKRRSR